jgi:hypothetical protein
MKVVNESYQMKEGKQKIFDTSKTFPQKNRTASEGYVGGQTFSKPSAWYTPGDFPVWGWGNVIYLDSSGR